jgi:cytochrome P450
MRRIALEDVKLSDGTIVPKNTTLAVSSHRMWDAEVHENPNQWDGYRFYNMRSTAGYENISQLVSTGEDNLAFGHGKHACPGRFFAANEVKVALVYLLLQYDWALVEKSLPDTRYSGLSMILDPDIEMKIRRRQEEMEL